MLVYTTLFPAIRDLLVGASGPLYGALFTAVGATLLLGIVLATFRWEGVHPSAVGLSPTHARRAVVWFAATVVTANALLLVVAVLAADRWVFALAGVPPTVWVALALSQWVFVGLAEELAGRAYLQNKLVVLFSGERDLPRRTAAVLVMAVLFALWHVPQRLVGAGLSPEALPGALLALTLFALVLGVVYELTRNVVLVALLYGAMNLQPVFLLVHGSETWQAALSLLALFTPFLLGLLVSRRWLAGGLAWRTTPV